MSGRRTYKRCKECGTETFHTDHICALCRSGVTELHDELVYLLMEGKYWTVLQKLDMKKELSNYKEHYFPEAA
jgi:uncharacterized OB-fold protein